MGWVELSPEALRQMERALTDKEQGVVDEIGVLAIHSGYADRFFPGTSVLHTRPRYLFFASWNFLWLSRRGHDATTITEAREKADAWVRDRLKLEESQGVIGARIAHAPSQPPDFIYWTGLKRYRFYEGPGRGALYSRWGEVPVQRVGDPAPRARGEAPEQDTLALFSVPQMPRTWQKRTHPELRFALPAEEACFLRDRLLALDPPCLLSRAAALVGRHPLAGTHAWDSELIRAAARDLPGGELAVLERSAQAASLTEFVRALYAALVERIRWQSIPAGQRAHLEAPDYYRDVLRSYWTDDSSIIEDVSDVDLEAVSEDIRLPGGLLALLRHVQDRVRRTSRAPRVASQLLDDDTHQEFETVERARKNPNRARLVRTLAGLESRADFGPGTVRVYPVNYRWTQVHAMLRDIGAGLRSGT